MTSDLVPFDYAGQQVRTVLIDGDPWFVLADLTRVLGLTQFRTDRLDDGVISNHPILDNLGRTQQTTIVSEAGMYEVVIRSDKPEAVAFRRWITGDVLPQIRKTGSYNPQPQLTGPELMAYAVLEAAETIKQRDAQVRELTPKAEAFDAFLSTTGDLSIRDAAHVLSRDFNILTGEKRLRETLIGWRWMYRDSASRPRAYQVAIDSGRLVEKAQWHYHPETGEKVLDCPQVRILAKGMDDARKRLLQDLVA